MKKPVSGKKKICFKFPPFNYIAFEAAPVGLVYEAIEPGHIEIGEIAPGTH
jgi:hypothetical protein